MSSKTTVINFYTVSRTAIDWVIGNVKSARPIAERWALSATHPAPVGLASGVYLMTHPTHRTYIVRADIIRANFENHAHPFKSKGWYTIRADGVGDEFGNAKMSGPWDTIDCAAGIAYAKSQVVR